MTGEKELVPGGIQEEVQIDEGFQPGGGASTSSTSENVAVPAPGPGIGEKPGSVDSSSAGGATTGNGTGAGGPASENGGGGSSRSLHQSAPSSVSVGASKPNENFRAIQQHLLRGQKSMSQSSKGSADSSAAKTYKQMLESVKKLEASGDRLQERISNMYCQFGDAVLNGSFMFDPSLIEIMQSDPPVLGCELRDPTTVHFTRQAVDEDYQSLIRRLDVRPPIKVVED